MVAPSRLRMGLQPQSTMHVLSSTRRTWPGNATAHLGLPDLESQPAELSARRTGPANATAHSRLPNKAAPRRTSEQKHADDEQVRRVKEAKKSTLNDAYQ